MRCQGKVTNWKDDQGFGFVTPNGGGDKAFVHISAFSSGSSRPSDGDLISYALTKDERGRYQATDVRRVGRQPEMARRGGTPPFSTAIAVLFLAVLLAATLTGKLPWHVVGVYGLASLVTFIAYAWDKAAARDNQWRTKESTLHLLALVGGWPGALLAQNVLRHKSSKQQFLALFWATVIFNCGILGWLFTEHGAAFTRSLINAWITY